MTLPHPPIHEAQRLLDISRIIAQNSPAAELTDLEGWDPDLLASVGMLQQRALVFAVMHLGEQVTELVAVLKLQNQQKRGPE